MTAGHRYKSSEPNRAVVGEALQSCLPFKAGLKDIVLLAGDASNRRYFRLMLTDSPVASLILMQLADPETFKVSEEATSGITCEIAELPFINVLRHLSKAQVSVPILYYNDEEGGLLYLEDLGDLTLAQACRQRSLSDLENLYSQAIDVLVHLHLNATFVEDNTCTAFHRAFDVPLFMWEFDHFLEYGVVARQEKPLDHQDEQMIRLEFQRIAELLAGQPRVFTHRDYHSRNLMVKNQHLGVIDFQDALLGPPTYDLASLLRDSYIALDEGLIEAMLDRYVGGMRAGLNQPMQEKMLLNDPVAFRRLFDLTSIQRNLKAAGRFVYIDKVKKNPHFLADVPRKLP